MVFGRESNLSEALIQCKKIEKHFLQREYTSIDKERRKIRSNIDGRMGTFLALHKKRHENWWKYDRHFREHVRKENEKYEKRKEQLRKPFRIGGFNRPPTPFKILDINDTNLTVMPETNSTVLPMITESTITKTTIDDNHMSKRENISSTAMPVSKAQQRVHEVLKSSQKLLADSAKKTHHKQQMKTQSLFSSSSLSTHSAATSSMSIVRTISPLTFSSLASGYYYKPIPLIDDDYYQQLLLNSIQHETYEEFINHFIKFRPEFREKFSSMHEDMKRSIAMGKLRSFNQVLTRRKDDRYHQLISSLVDFRSNKLLSRKKMELI
ncbi:unnamed protein product [Didymodactylos carnosus]|uniref:Uncharacterized protein n=1 Tax=Didymodactylos carnosus TaxID=1234261 RepID=A0A813NNN4_9BILA|nr:unnamed protein product [Didymodactylos carnosus]CAF1506797.1 unnamed protein product [Didymodactylos carnosus]CAF3516432.1 unnamed protein product [Didymodactylos carnosus]CAF4294950.1 unnamed protein product [Didymodactylos carnosus]